MKHRTFTLLTSLVIVLASVMRISELPEISIPNIDKPVHFAMYALLVMVALAECRNHNVRAYLLSSLYAVLFGGAMELVQALLPWRSCSVYDFAANCIGTAAGVTIYALVSLARHKSKP